MNSTVRFCLHAILPVLWLAIAHASAQPVPAPADDSQTAPPATAEPAVSTPIAEPTPPPATNQPPATGAPTRPGTGSLGPSGAPGGGMGSGFGGRGGRARGGGGIGGMGGSVYGAGGAPMAGSMQPGMMGGPVGSSMNPMASNEARILKVLALKYTDCEYAAMLISQLQLPDGGPQLSADARTNSLILNGTEPQLAMVESLLAKLDVPQQPQRTMTATQIFRPQRAIAKSLATTLRELVGNRATIALDEPTNAIIVAGDDATTAEALNILQQLDQPVVMGLPAVPAAQISRRIRLVWLVSGMPGQPVPPDLADVAEELAQMGIEDLALGAQTFVSTLARGEFQMRCTPGFLNQCMLDMNGRIEDEGGTPQLQLQLDVAGMLPVPGGPSEPAQYRPAGPGVPPPNRSLASLKTSLSAPPGHKVVIGAAPMGAITSVFVIQVGPASNRGGESPVQPGMPLLAPPIPVPEPR